jgi:kumamolisin
LALEIQRQNNLNPCRCQPTTVSGSTTMRTLVQLRQARRRMSSNPEPDQVSTNLCHSTRTEFFSSTGWVGGPSTTTDNIFQSMQAVGQSFFRASGDSDAFTTGASSVNGVDNPSLANAPSSCPYITQAGGTTLTMSGTGAAWSSETVWNWGDVPADGGYVGSSGGISSYYPIPSWQMNISNLTGVGGSSSYRNIPDVALTADNVYVAYSDGSTAAFGGTSCAAPL